MEDTIDMSSSLQKAIQNSQNVDQLNPKSNSSKAFNVTVQGGKGEANDDISTIKSDSTSSTKHSSRRVPNSTKILCKFFSQGGCKYGNSCRFLVRMFRELYFVHTDMFPKFESL